MVPSIIIADAGVNEAIPMPLGHGALEIGERRNWVIVCVKSATTAPTSYPILQVRISAFLRGYSSSHRLAREMRYGLLNDVRVLDKEAWPLWWNAMSRWPMTKALCVPHKTAAAIVMAAVAGERR